MTLADTYGNFLKVCLYNGRHYKIIKVREKQAFKICIALQSTSSYCQYLASTLHGLTYPRPQSNSNYSMDISRTLALFVQLSVHLIIHSV